MYRRLVAVGLFLAAVVVSVSAAQGQVNESASNANPLEEASWLIGRWEAEYKLPSGVPELGAGGETVREVLSWRWVLDKKFVIFRSRMEIEGKPAFTTLEVTGVDPESGGVTSSLFNSTGAQGRGVWEKEGETLIFKWSVTQPDTTVYKGVSYVRKDSDEQYTWGMKDVTRAGEKIADWGPVTYKKRPGRERRDR